MSLSTKAELGRNNRKTRNYTLQEALDKVYLIKNKRFSVPVVLIGKRVKLVVVKNELVELAEVSK